MSHTPLNYLEWSAKFYDRLHQQHQLSARRNQITDESILDLPKFRMNEATDNTKRQLPL